MIPIMSQEEYAALQILAARLPQLLASVPAPVTATQQCAKLDPETLKRDAALEMSKHLGPKFLNYINI